MKKISFLLIFCLTVACTPDDPIFIENNPISGGNDSIPTVKDSTFIDNDQLIPIDEWEEEKILAGSLNSFFFNCLISDTRNNINRNNPIKIIAYDQSNNWIKTNYSNLKALLVAGSNNQNWFIAQNSEASTLVEIINVDVDTGWIALGNTYQGSLNTNIGASIEFFNPFTNYEIIKDGPLFDPYPTTVSEGIFNYIQPGGIFEKSDGSYVLLTPVVFGSHDSRSIYFATSTNLEDWTFHDDKILGSSTIPFAKTEGNVFSSGNPLKLENGNLVVLLGVQQPNGNYTSAYMIIDENLNVLQQPKEIMIPEWHGIDQNSFPLSITKFKNQYRILFHKRNPNFIDREIHEVIISNLFDALDLNESIISSKRIHKGTEESGYLRGKADDAAYITYNSDLYILLGSEEVPSNYLTSNNREYGLVRLDNGSWHHDSRGPLLVNPVQLYKKYPVYAWARDHLGGFVSPIIKNNTLYTFLAFGTDNPDYYISGIKTPLY